MGATLLETRMSTPLVSVIIGTYNRPNLLARAVRSVLSQTHGNFEIILVDDASTDNTPRVAQSFADPRVNYVRHEVNKGIAVASNTGFAHASGDYVALLGDDDEWVDPQKLETQLDCCRTDQSGRLGIVCTWWNQVGIRREHKLNRVMGSTRTCIQYYAISSNTLSSFGGLE